MAINPLDEVTPTDKQLHYLFSYMGNDVMHGLGFNWWQSLIATEVLGRVKEQIDVNCGGKFDNTDLRANRAGWLTYQVFNIRIKW